MLRKRSLMKLGELSLAGATLVSLSANMAKQSSAKALNNNDQIFTNTETSTLDTNALTRLMNNSAKHVANVTSLSNSKVASNVERGTLDVKNWQGHVDGNYFVLDNYTGDPYHIVVPNAADFKSAGVDIQGKQVGVTSKFMHNLYLKLYQYKDGASISFSNTDGDKVKAVDENWEKVFSNTDKYSEQKQKKQNYALKQFDGSGLDVSNITDMYNMFNGDQLSDVSSLKDWNLKNVTSTEYMFLGNNLTDLSPLANWNVSNDTDLEGMFYNNYLTNLNGLQKWNVGNAKDLSLMFQHNQLTDISAVSGWDTKSATSLSAIFGNNKLTNLNAVKDWTTDNVKNLANAFQHNNISDISGLSNWHTQNVTNMADLLVDNKLTNLDAVKSWKTGNVKNMHAAFDNNQINDISGLQHWDLSSVDDMQWMLGLNKISDLSPLSNWNVSHVQDISGLFQSNNISNLSPLTNWKTPNATKMNNMFEFNKISDIKPLQNWDTHNVQDMHHMFANNQLTDLTPLANWNTSDVQDMSYMFTYSLVKKADFSKWNFSKIKSSVKHVTDHDGTITGLDEFIDDIPHRSIIYMGANNTMPRWVMQQTVNGVSNKNIFTTSQGHHIILTSNQKLLANPNNAFNHIWFNKVSSTIKDKVDTPVFINSTFDKILNDSNSIQEKVLNDAKQKDTGYKFSRHGADFNDTGLAKAYDAQDPIDALNAVFTVDKVEQPVPNTPSTPNKRTPEDSSVFKQNIAEQKTDQLPEMAENKDSLVAAGVGVASLTSLAGLAGVKFKKRKN